MSLHDTSYKKNQRELALKRINLGNEYKSNNKTMGQQNKNVELSTKRLRYCFKHKTQKARQAKKLSDLCGNEEQNLSLRFYDTEYFRHNKNGIIPDHGQMIPHTQNQERNYSNLFEQSPSQNSPNKSQKTLTPSKNRKIRTSKEEPQSKILSNYINFEIEIPEHQSPLIKTERPKSSIDRRRDLNSAQKQKRCFRKSYYTTIKTQCQINPYTNEKYLYVRKKHKEKIKEVVEKIKKKQIMYNILKPCQIYQKQLSKREEYTWRAKESIEPVHQAGNSFDLAVKKRSANKQRKQVKKTKKGQQYQTIEPWQVQRQNMRKISESSEIL